MARTMSLTKALDVINRKEGGKKVPFSIRFVTLDHKRRTKGSKHLHFKSAEECGAAHNLKRHRQVGIRPLGKNATHQVAVHLRLITHINEYLVL